MMPQKEQDMEVTKNPVPPDALTNKSYTADQKAAKLAAIIKYALTFVGTKEIGFSNTGVDVSRWLKQAGCAPGNSWCMAFAYSMFLENGYINVNGKRLLKQTAGCMDQADFAREQGTLIAAASAKTLLRPGFLMLQYETDPLGYHHTGIVVKFDPITGDFWSVEGNTNNGGSRNGNEVLVQHRNVKDQRGGRSRYAFVATA